MLEFLFTLTLIVVGASVLAVAFAIRSYNRLVALNQRCDQSLADIDVQLRNRHDLIPSLVETVKGFAGHESGIIDKLMQARSQALRPATSEERMQAEASISQSIGQLLTVVEAYPEVKASSHFSELRRDITDIEHKIAAARRFLNAAVSEYNASLGQFPNGIIARKSGFNERRFFNLGVERMFVEEVPAFKF